MKTVSACLLVLALIFFPGTAPAAVWEADRPVPEPDPAVVAAMTVEMVQVIPGYYAAARVFHAPEILSEGDGYAVVERIFGATDVPAGKVVFFSGSRPVSEELVAIYFEERDNPINSLVSSMDFSAREIMKERNQSPNDKKAYETALAEARNEWAGDLWRFHAPAFAAEKLLVLYRDDAEGTDAAFRGKEVTVLGQSIALRQDDKGRRFVEMPGTEAGSGKVVCLVGGGDPSYALLKDGGQGVVVGKVRGMEGAALVLDQGKVYIPRQ
ncbi:exported hypothetical protein [uncultured delta proteobacterium]|uniref:Uncharacterized protein n=1 Tax=uncultured delta proteobacterium TaxID=34034 RepID=A0A212JID3_9DELT|nr:exported hypothetical protein [uncultured delta proteobacterium]